MRRRALLARRRSPLAIGLGLSARPLVQTAPAAPFFFIQLTDPQFGMYDEQRGLRAGDGEPRVRRRDRQPPAAGLRRRHRRPRQPHGRRGADRPSTCESWRSSTPRFPRLQPARQPRRRQRADAGIAGRLHEALRPRLAITFRLPGFVGIVVNSCLMHAPQKASKAAAEQQDQWLQGGAERARARGRASHRRLPAPPALPEGRGRARQLRRASRSRAADAFVLDVSARRACGTSSRALPPERAGPRRRPRGGDDRARSACRCAARSRGCGSSSSATTGSSTATTNSARSRTASTCQVNRAHAHRAHPGRLPLARPLRADAPRASPDRRRPRVAPARGLRGRAAAAGCAVVRIPPRAGPARLGVRRRHGGRARRGGRHHPAGRAVAAR